MMKFNLRRYTNEEEYFPEKNSFLLYYFADWKKDVLASFFWEDGNVLSRISTPKGNFQVGYPFAYGGVKPNPNEIKLKIENYIIKNGLM